MIKLRSKYAQTAIEYLILLGAIAALVIIGVKNWSIVTNYSSNIYYHRVSRGIMGPAPRCGDGVCANVYEDGVKCCIDCGTCP